MGKDNHLKTVEKVVAKEKVMEKLPFNSNIWRKVNPIYEAIARTFIKYIKNEVIGQRIYNSGEIDEMGELIGIQSLMKRLEKNKRNQIENKLKKNIPIEEVVDFAALQIAEDKRTNEGNVLYRASQENPDKFFMKALKEANPRYLYIERGEIDGIKKRRNEIRKKDKIKKVAATIILTGAIIYSSFYVIKNRKRIGESIKFYKDIKIEKVIGPFNSINKGLSDKQIRLSSLEAKLKNIEQSYQEKQQQISSLENEISKERQVLFTIEKI